MLTIGSVVLGVDDLPRATAFWMAALDYVPLGARRVDWDRYPPDPDFVVLADTEGNIFCVIDAGRGRLSPRVLALPRPPMGRPRAGGSPT